MYLQPLPLYIRQQYRLRHESSSTGMLKRSLYEQKNKTGTIMYRLIHTDLKKAWIHNSI